MKEKAFVYFHINLFISSAELPTLNEYGYILKDFLNIILFFYLLLLTPEN